MYLDYIMFWMATILIYSIAFGFLWTMQEGKKPKQLNKEDKQ